MVHAALEPFALQQPFVVCAAVGGIGVNGWIAVAPIEQWLKTLGVMHVGGGYVVAADDLVLDVDGDMVLVTVIVFAVLLGPACLGIFLDFLGRVLIPGGGHQAFFDGRVFGSRVRCFGTSTRRASMAVPRLAS